MKTQNVVRLFIPLYQSLRIGGIKEPVFGLDLTSAPAMGKTKALYAFESLGGFPSVSGQLYSLWCIDHQGVAKIETWPYPQGIYSMDEMIDKPKIKFTHNDNEVIFGMSFGPGWYVKRQATFTKEGIKQIRQPDSYFYGPSSGGIRLP